MEDNVSPSPTKVFVLPVKGQEANTQALKALVQQAGCVLVCDEAPIEDFRQCIEAADVLVILICPETINDPLVEEAINLANRLGKRIVGVWAPGVSDDQLPPALHRHGDGAITCDLDAIRRHICEPSPVWTTPTGEARPKPKTPRHKG